jgi:hypothetical protein
MLKLMFRGVTRDSCAGYMLAVCTTLTVDDFMAPNKDGRVIEATFYPEASELLHALVLVTGRVYLQ